MKDSRLLDASHCASCFTGWQAGASALNDANCSTAPPTPATPPAAAAAAAAAGGARQVGLPVLLLLAAGAGIVDAATHSAPFCEARHVSLFRLLQLPAGHFAGAQVPAGSLFELKKLLVPAVAALTFAHAGSHALPPTAAFVPAGQRMHDVDATAKLTSFFFASHMMHCCRCSAAPAGHNVLNNMALLAATDMVGLAFGRAVTLLLDVKLDQLPAAISQVNVQPVVGRTACSASRADQQRQQPCAAVDSFLHNKGHPSRTGVGPPSCLPCSMQTLVGGCHKSLLA
jgi:hypothetical protein